MKLKGLPMRSTRWRTNLQRSFAQIEQRVVDVRRLEEKYRDLIEHSPEMIYQLDRSGQFVHVNKTGIEKLKYSLDEMLSMRLWDLVPRGQEPLVLQYLEQLVAQGRSSMETVFLTKDGHPIDVEIHATALIDQERGGLVHSRAFVHDVTERHRLERHLQDLHDESGTGRVGAHEQLVASQARYKALFDLVADSVFMVDPNGMHRRRQQTRGASAGVCRGECRRPQPARSGPLRLSRGVAWMAERRHFRAAESIHSGDHGAPCRRTGHSG